MVVSVVSKAACVELALSAALVVVPPAHGQGDLTIYDEQLHAGWQSWSWAAVNLASTAQAHNGVRSIQVKITAPWQAFDLHHSPTGTAPYSALAFWVHGGSAGGQRLGVSALVNGVSQPVLPLAGYIDGGEIAAGEWRQATVPLTDLGAAGTPVLTDLRLQDAVGAVQPAFYLDDIVLVGAPIPPVVHLRVDATQTLRLVDDRLFGLNATRKRGSAGALFGTWRRGTWR